MTVNSKAREQADAKFNRKQQQATEGAKAMADYHAEGRAIREKTERLRKARLARDAARVKTESQDSIKPPVVKAPRSSRVGKAPAKPAAKPRTAKPPATLPGAK